MKTRTLRLLTGALVPALLAAAPLAHAAPAVDGQQLAASPCAGKNPCAAKKNPCAGKNPCAAKASANPCAGKNPCAAKKNPCAAKK